LAVRDRVVPPLCHLRRPLDAPFLFVRGTAAARPIDRALVLGIARGGAVAALLVQRPV